MLLKGSLDILIIIIICSATLSRLVQWVVLLNGSLNILVIIIIFSATLGRLVQWIVLLKVVLIYELLLLLLVLLSVGLFNESAIIIIISNASRQACLFKYNC